MALHYRSQIISPQRSVSNLIYAPRTISRINPIQKAIVKKKVCAYCRVSTLLEAQETSIKNQWEHFTQVIQSNPEWEFAGIYADIGKSGKRAENRSELQRMMADARNGKIDRILTKSVSRFARNTKDTLCTIRELKDLKVSVYFEEENIDTFSWDAEFMLTIVAAVAAWESESIASNVKWTIKKKFQDQTFRFSKAPFGYDLIGGNFMPNEETAPIAAEIFKMALEDKGACRIAAELNRRGIPTGTKKLNNEDNIWTTQMVLGILTNKAYTGDVILGKTYHEGPKRYTNRGEKDMYQDIEHHEAIIDEQTFDRVQELIRQHRLEKKQTGGARTQNRYPFSGKIICSCCGSPMKRITQKANPPRFYWGCSQHIKDKDKCVMKRIAEPNIENTFVTLMNKLQTAPIIIDTYIEKSKEQSLLKNQRQLAELQKLIRMNIEEQNRLKHLISRGCGLPVYYLQQVVQLQNDAEEYAKKLEDLNEAAPLIEKAKELQKVIRHWTGKYSGEIFAQVVEKVEVQTGNQITFHMYCGMVLEESLLSVQIAS